MIEDHPSSNTMLPYLFRFVKPQIGRKAARAPFLLFFSVPLSNQTENANEDERWKAGQSQPRQNEKFGRKRYDRLAGKGEGRRKSKCRVQWWLYTFTPIQNVHFVAGEKREGKKTRTKQPERFSKALSCTRRKKGKRAKRPFF